MDPVRTGKQIAQLRRRKGLTQESLGLKLGVSNKTISRWENGIYLPDVEMLQLLAQEFGVTMEELISGETPTPKPSQQSAVKIIAAPKPEGSFSFEEQKAYFKKKWRKDHIGLLAVLIGIFLAAVILPFVFGKPWFAGLAPLIGLLEYGYQNNQMMIYVENNLFD